MHLWVGIMGRGQAAMHPVRRLQEIGRTSMVRLRCSLAATLRSLYSLYLVYVRELA